MIVRLMCDLLFKVGSIKGLKQKIGADGVKIDIRAVKIDEGSTFDVYIEYQNTCPKHHQL